MRRQMATVFSSLICCSLLLGQVSGLASLSLSRSTVTVVEPQSGCQVVLLGCFHGSPTSSNDVVEALNELKPDGLVLELCLDRYMKLQETQVPPEGVSTNWFVGLAKGVSATREKQGWPSAIVLAVLAVISGIAQQSAWGIESGLEFRTAMNIAKDRQIDLILADQPFDDTLRRLGKLPNVAFDLLLEGGYWMEAQSLQRAVFGASAGDVNLPSFLTRSVAASVDFSKWLMLPASLLLALQLLISDFGMAVEAPPDMDSFSDSMLLFNAVAISLAYMGLTLPATRVIFSERDDYMASGIRTACVGRKRIVAVLGFLHVNGVASRLSKHR